MSIFEFLSQPLWQRLGLTLVHFLWQGLAVAVLAGVLVRVFRLKHGNARYGAYLLAFIAMIACPVVTFTAIDISISPNTELVTGAESTEVVDSSPYTALSAGDILPEAETRRPAIPTLADSIPLGQRISNWLNVSMPWVLVIWMAGVVVLSVRLLMGFVGVYRWRHHLEPLPERLVQRIVSLSEELGMRMFSRVFISPTVLQAMAVGYLRPMVLLPAAMVTHMQPEMLEAVIAHELAHIRRFDLWINLAQRVTETLLFYHPAVWWLSNCIRRERELCCDELAVKATGQRLTYATTLESVGRARFVAKPPVLAAGLGQDNKPTLNRVRHILGLDNKRKDSRFWLAGVIAVLLIMALVIPTGFALTARSEDKPDVQGKSPHIDVETLLNKVRQAQRPTENMIVEWQYESPQPVFAVAGSRKPDFSPPSRILQTYKAIIAGDKSRIEERELTFQSQKDTEPSRIREITYVFDGTMQKQLDHFVKGFENEYRGYRHTYDKNTQLLLKLLLAYPPYLDSPELQEKYNLKVIENKEKGLIILETSKENSGIHRFTIDPDKDYNIVKQDVILSRGTDYEINCIVKKQANGLWYQVAREKIRYSAKTGKPFLENKVKITKLDFNPEIPTGAFELQFPKGIKIWDGSLKDWIIVGDEEETSREPAVQVEEMKFDYSKFSQMNEKEKVGFVLSVLQMRDAKLQNFAYEMTHRLQRFTPKDGKREFRDEASIGIKRKGKKLLLTIEKLDSKKRLQKYRANWDGTTAKSLLYRPYRKVTHSGLIRDREDNNFTYRAFNHILGLRLLDTPKLTLNEWFNESMTKGRSIDIDIVEEKGKSLIMFKVTVGYKYWQWFLDVDRDYMPIRAEILYKVDENYNSDSSVVEEAIQVDGFWVPKKVFRRTGTSAGDGQGENTYEISTFTRNTVTDEDFEISFPPGTKVVDTIEKIAYRVLPNGSREMLPLLDSETGEVIKPIKPIIADVIEDAAKTDKVKRGAREAIETFVAAAMAGDFEKARQFADPDKAPYDQIEELPEVLKGQNLWIMAVVADDFSAIAVSSVIRGDHERIGPLVFFLDREPQGGRDNWWVDDIDMETPDSAEVELKQFLEKHPQAKKVPYEKKAAGAEVSNDFMAMGDDQGDIRVITNESARAQRTKGQLIKPEIIKTSDGRAKLLYLARHVYCGDLAKLVAEKIGFITDKDITCDEGKNQISIVCPTTGDAETVFKFLQEVDVEPIQVRMDLLVVETYPDVELDHETKIAAENVTHTKFNTSLSAADILRESVKTEPQPENSIEKLVDLLTSRGYLKILMNPTLEVVNGKTAKVRSSYREPTGKEIIDSFEVTPQILDDGNIDVATKMVFQNKQMGDPRTHINIKDSGSLVIGSVTKTEKRDIVRDGVKGSEERTTEVLVILTPTIITPEMNLSKKPDVQVESEQSDESAGNVVLSSKGGSEAKSSEGLTLNQGREGSISGKVVGRRIFYQKPESLVRNVLAENFERREDSPLPGVKIFLRKDKKALGETITDETGHYAFEDLGPGHYTVYALKPAGTAFEVAWMVPMAGPGPWEDHGTSNLRKVEVKSEPQTDVDLHFRLDGVSIAGRVTDDNGKPVSGAGVVIELCTPTKDGGEGRSGAYSKIKLWYGMIRTKTDKDGRFKLDGFCPVTFSEIAGYLMGGEPYRRYEVRVQAEGYSPARILVPPVTEHLASETSRLVEDHKSLFLKQDSLVDEVDLPKSQGSDITGIDLVLQKQAVVAGRVLDTQGNVLPGPRPKASVRLVCVDSSNDKSESLLVQMPDRAGLNWIALDETGRFRIDAVPPGSYLFEVDTIEHRSQRATNEPFTVSAGQVINDIKVIVPSEKTDAPVEAGKETLTAKKLVLKLVDNSGRPVAGAQVGTSVRTRDEQVLNSKLYWSLSGKEKDVSDEDGKIVLTQDKLFPQSWNPDRRRTLYILNEERQIGAFCEISKDNERNQIELTLEPVCHVHGNLRSKDLEKIGRPLTWSNVYLSFNKDSHGVLSCMSKKQQFDFWVPPGEYTLSAYGSGDGASTKHVRPIIEVKTDQSELDLGVVDLPATKLSKLMGKSAPEIGPIMAWKNGSPVKLSELRGKPVILHFGGGYPSTGRDLPILVKLHEDIHDAGLVIIAIYNCESMEQLEQRFRTNSEKFGGAPDVPFRLAVDGGQGRPIEGTDRTIPGATYAAYEISVYTTTVLINSKGDIVEKLNIHGAKEKLENMLGVEVKTTVSAWRQRFEEVYRLEDGQVLKRISPPFMPERLEFYNHEESHQAAAIPEPPDYFTFHWEDSKLKIWGSGFTGGKRPLDSILRHNLSIEANKFDGPEELLQIEIPGDWIIRMPSTIEERLKSLEKRLSEGIGRDIRFEKREVGLEVVVAAGNFKFHPPSETYEHESVHLYADELDPDEGSGGGTADSVNEFLAKLGGRIDMTVIDQTTPSKEIKVPYRHHRSSYLRKIKDKSEKAGKLQMLLANLTKQTELQFRIEKRPVEVWFITEKKKDK